MSEGTSPPSRLTSFPTGSDLESYFSRWVCARSKQFGRDHAAPVFVLLGIVLLGVLLLGIWVFNLRRDLLGNFYSLLFEDPLLQSWFGDNILLLDGA